MRLVAATAAILLLATGAQAADEQWGPPTSPYSATLTFTDGRGETLKHRIFHTPTRQRIDYKTGEREEIVIVDQEAAAVFALYPEQKRYRKAVLVEPEFDLGISRQETKRTRLAEESVAGRSAVKYRVEAKTAQGQEFKGQAWLTPERILVQLDGEVKQGRRIRRIKMSTSDLKVGPIDPSVFKVPDGYALIQDKRR